MDAFLVVLLVVALAYLLVCVAWLSGARRRRPYDPWAHTRVEARRRLHLRRRQ